MPIDPASLTWTQVDVTRIGEMVLRVYLHPSERPKWQVSDGGRMVDEGTAENYHEARRAAVEAAERELEGSEMEGR